MSRRRSNEQEVLQATGPTRQTRPPAAMASSQAVGWDPDRRAPIEAKGYKHHEGSPRGRRNGHPNGHSRLQFARR